MSTSPISATSDMPNDERSRSTSLRNVVGSKPVSHFTVKEKTPTSLILRLSLPPHKLRDLVYPGDASATLSLQSSPPPAPSSPITIATAAEETAKVSNSSATTPGAAIATATSKKKSAPKSKKTKIVIGGDGKPVEVLTNSLSSRLGPKANAGAINENLRNLDRSGKPCRRWQKKQIVVRSLHGGKWKTLSYVGDIQALDARHS